jgi:pyrroloquinoline quinone (PQQ) biosynthesis protein C
MQFYDQLVKQTNTDKQKFYSRKIISSVLQEGVSKQLYLNYLTQAYNHVKYTCPLLEMSKNLMSLDKDKVFIDAFEEYIEEEKGHEEWILNDIKNIGGKPDGVRNSDGGIAVRALISFMKYSIEKISPYSMLGMIYVLEGTSVNIAQEAAEAIAKKNNLNLNKGFSYLISHGKLDLSHVEFYKKLVNQVEDVNLQKIIIDTAKTVFLLWGNVFDEVADNYKINPRKAA